MLVELLPRPTVQPGVGLRRGHPPPLPCGNLGLRCQSLGSHPGPAAGPGRPWLQVQTPASGLESRRDAAPPTVTPAHYIYSTAPSLSRTAQRVQMKHPVFLPWCHEAFLKGKGNSEQQHNNYGPRGIRSVQLLPEAVDIDNQALERNLPRGFRE